MEKCNKNKKFRCIDNQGFSLVELIISIAILVIIMIPLMNNFYQSMVMNKKAENIQKQTNLATNIMEGLKTVDMEDTIDQFTGVDSFDILTIGSGDPRVLKPLGGSYQEETDYNALTGQATYYFAINDIKIEGTAYDALIKMNAADYRMVTDIMNDYPMPNAINLDITANGLFFSMGATDTDTIDEQALAAYIQMGDVYARQLFGQSTAYQNYLIQYDQWQNEREIAIMNGLPTPAPIPELVYNPLDYPDYTTPDVVKTKISKTMRVIINNSSRTLEYQINYERVWPAGCNLNGSLQYQIISNTYPSEIENVYLFYRPSIFTVMNSDRCEIVNTTSSVYPVNFYLANQDMPVTKEVIISKGVTDQTTVYTNINPTLTALMIGGIIVNDDQIGSGIVKTEVKDRIYETTVDIYEHVNSTNVSDKYKKRLYSITSTREN